VRVEASKELLASREDVWALLSEPYHFSDWWPGVSSVRPDRRGFAPGARWELVGAPQPTLFRRANAVTVAVVKRIEPLESVLWHLVSDRLDVEVRLHAAGPDRTEATVAIEGPWRPELLGFPRRLPREAVSRLHALCQTAATL
jgi:uncharacterized protein YndB with AHSA1/START domain